MMNTSSSLAIISLLLAAVVNASDCKCMPSEPCWPSETEWSLLNQTLTGRLIHVVPPASVCYPSEPNYNETACDTVLADWSKSTFHSADPASVNSVWSNKTCNPIYPNGTSIAGDPEAGARGCSLGALPLYVVNATEASHVQTALKFVRQFNLRVNVKNTGHNGAGRNLAYGSLSIWIHHMKQIQFHKDFQPQACSMNTTTSDNQMAATLGAGVQDGELYDAMERNNAVAVGGTNLDVGIVGWATGGGHGFLTGLYGMGADNILEAVIVTPKGDILTANSCQNQDIFWAIRGGGGGTFGIITSITLKAYPVPTMQLWGLNIMARNETLETDWWKLVARLHSLLPAVQDQGLKGYYTINGPPSASTLTFSGAFFVWGKPNGTFERITTPIQQMLQAANKTATFSVIRVPVSGFSELLTMLPDTERVGTSTSIVASRLISRRAVSDENLALLASTFEQVGPRAIAPSDGSPNPTVSGTMNIGTEKVNNALNPAWRDAVVHFITSQAWKDSLPSAQVQQIVKDVTYTKLNALRQLAPESGAYLNEANAFEPGWQWSFFGPNYGRLRAIKDQYDPNGVLWCRQCVGSEDWVQGDDGSLCREYQPY